MVIIALLLIAAGAAVAASMIIENTAQNHITLFGQGVDTSATMIFLLGAAAMLAVLLGVWLLQRGAARSRRRRREVKTLKRSRREEVGALEQERARLASEKADLESKLAREHEARIAESETTAATGATAAPIDRREVDLTEAERRETTGR